MTTNKSWKNLSFARILLIACSSALMSSSAFAIADGSSGCWQSEIRYTAMHGTEEQLVAEIDKIADKWFDSFERASLKRRFGSPTVSKKPTKPSIDRLRAVFVNLWAGCPGKLIDYAVAAGNIANTDRLLLLGADPAGRSIADDTDAVLAAVFYEGNSTKTPYRIRFKPDDNIFRRCIDAQRIGYLSSSRRHHKNDSLVVDQDARASLFRRLIRATNKSDIIARDRFMDNALTTCDDPYILKLLIDAAAGSGVDCPSSTDTTNCESALDKRTIDYIHRSYNKSHRAERLELLRLVASAHPTRTLTRAVETNICHACRNSIKDPTVCNELKSLINVRHPASLLPRSDYKPNLDPRSEAAVCYELPN